MKLNKQQSIILIITLLAFIFLVVEVYQLIHTDISGNPSKSIATSAAKLTGNEPAIPMERATLTPVFQAQLPASTAEREKQLVTHQNKYVDLVNQYEMAKMERQVLEEQVAIAEAKQRIAELNQKTAQFTGMATASDTSSSLNVAKAQTSLPAYQLSYLDHQSHGYSATLANNGQYLEVTPGFQLPDGFSVLHINAEGVILEKNQQQFQLTFEGVSPLAKESTLENVSSQQSTAELENTSSQQSTAELETQSPPQTTSTSLVLSTQDQSLSLIPAAVNTNETSASNPYTLDEVLLLELPPTGYTILLKTDDSESALTAFAKAHSIGENAIYFARPTKDNKKYVLLYSYYSTRTEAESALQNLPLALKQQHPKIESLSTIQNIICSEKIATNS